MAKNKKKVSGDIANVEEGTSKEQELKQVHHKPNIKELMDMLQEMCDSFDRLPPHGQYSYCTQCDLNAALLLLNQILIGLAGKS